MGRPMSVSDSVVVAAPADHLWQAVADPSQMGRWSPENLGTAEPTGGPLSAGAVFVGANRRGRVRWQTQCRVTVAEPGRRFTFRVERIGARRPRVRAAIATWDYLFEPVEGGTRVTETWHDDRRGWPDALAGVFDRAVTGGRLFSDFQRRNIATTLARLRTDAEQG